MRLAFDKATVIITDDSSDFCFDIGMIEHVVYGRELRYSDTVKLREDLRSKVPATYLKSRESDYSAFLKHFTKLELKPATLPTISVSTDPFLAEKLTQILQQLAEIRLERVNSRDLLGVIQVPVRDRPPAVYTDSDLAAAAGEAQHRWGLMDEVGRFALGATRGRQGDRASLRGYRRALRCLGSLRFGGHTATCGLEGQKAARNTATCD